MIIKSQFFWRSYLSYVALVLLATFVLAAVLINRLQRVEMGLTEDSLRSQAALLSASVVRPLLTLNYDAIREIVERFSTASGSRFTVIDVNGVVLADSHENSLRMSNHLSRPEVQQAILRGGGQSLRYSETLKQEFWYFSLPVYSEQQLLAVVRSAKPSSGVAAALQNQQNYIISSVASIAFVGLLLAFYLSARQTQIVEKVTRVANVIASGDFEKRVSEDNALGLRTLAEAINQLARNAADKVSVITADRNRLATIFAGMVEGVIDVDQNQNVIHINEAAEKLLDVSGLSSSGKPVWEVIRNHEITLALDKAIKTQSVIKTQMLLSLSLRGKVNEMVVDIYAASLSDDLGNPVGAVAVLHDVTELKNLE
ncbi:cell wall metabolism sensor histidine kinase WalK, partial [Gammaproteobacteria bacterium]|nr:cell wall metabolism sensor histidine kinase WalK [Gammaproteobacteria bacterium]